MAWMAALGKVGGALGSMGISGDTAVGAVQGAADKGESKIQGRKNAHMQGTMGAFQAVQGLGQSIQGAIMNKRANALFPDKVDPIRAQALSNYKRMERGAATGSLFQSELDKILQGQRGRDRKIMRNAGGNTGGALMAAGLSSRAGGKDRNELMGLVMKNRDNYTALADATSKEISQRRLELESWKYSQKKAQAMQMFSQGQANMNAGATNMLSSAWG